jgi:hypothetical protein
MAEDNFGQDELVETLATSTAVAAPARKSFKDVQYIRDFVPELRADSQLLQQDYKKLMKSLDSWIKTFDINPKDFDRYLLNEIISDVGNTTHADVADKVQWEFVNKLMDMDPSLKEKKAGEFLRSLIELEEEVTGKSLKSFTFGAYGNELSLFDSFSREIATDIEQLLGRLHTFVGKERLKNPLDVAKQMEQGKFNKFAGADETIDEIARSLSDYLINAKLETTRTFVPETQQLGNVAWFLQNEPELIKNAEALYPDDLDLPGFKEFMKTRTNTFLTRNKEFYNRLSDSKIIDDDMTKFGRWSEQIQSVPIFLKGEINMDHFVSYNKGWHKAIDIASVDATETFNIKPYKGSFIPIGIEDVMVDKGTAFLKDPGTPDLKLNVTGPGRIHMRPISEFMKIAQDTDILLETYDKVGNRTRLTPLSFASNLGNIQNTGTIDLWAAPGYEEKLPAFTEKITKTPLDEGRVILTIGEETPESKRVRLENIRSTFVDNHGEDALKKAEDIVKNKPKFASRVLKGLSKLDVGQEVIEKALTKVGTKYGMASVTGPAAGLLAFYETMVLAADVTNAATKAAFDKDVDFWDNFGKIDDKYSITYKLTKPFYETLFKGIGSITKPNTENNQVQSYYGK